MHHVEFPGVGIGHTAAFSADGEIAVFGHEPGGGSAARCQATSSVVARTIYFVDVEAGTVAGSLLHPRPQTSLENCTWHNLNIVPTNKGRFFVAGNYQSGISVVDFTDPAAAKEIAFADPSPLADPNPPTGIELGGDWSSYYYNGYIYESDITRGLLVWDRESEADLAARQKAEQAAFAASQQAALTRSPPSRRRRRQRSSPHSRSAKPRAGRSPTASSRSGPGACRPSTRSVWPSTAHRGRLSRPSRRTSGPTRPPSSRSRRATARTGG